MIFNPTAFETPKSTYHPENCSTLDTLSGFSQFSASHEKNNGSNEQLHAKKPTMPNQNNSGKKAESTDFIEHEQLSKFLNNINLSDDIFNQKKLNSLKQQQLSQSEGDPWSCFKQNNSNGKESLNNMFSIQNCSISNFEDEQFSLFASSKKKSFGQKSNQHKSGQKSKVDRFIPNRKASKLSIAFTSAHDIDENYYLSKNDPNRLKGKDINAEKQVSVMQMYKSHVLGMSNKKQYNSEIEEEHESHSENIFKFQNSEIENNENIMLDNALLGNVPKTPLCSVEDILLNKNNIINTYNPNKSSYRKIPKVPFKVLDAPKLQNDYYLNLIDWSSTNQLAVALESCVYLWNAESNKVIKFCDLGKDNLVTSVHWNQEGSLLSVGTSSGHVQIWDAATLKQVLNLEGHTGRVGSLAWGSQLLASGSKDKSILYRDLRTNTNYIQKLEGHRQEVCGIKWSFDGQQLASGGNDNKLMIWNNHSSSPIAKLSQHCAAVKALAWSPHQHSLLASGGGTADRTIRFWNTYTLEQLNYIDTGSQVCNLMFSKDVNELVSTHGYSMNQICLWKYPTMEKIGDLYGHTQRVLFLAASPDGETIVTGAGDETLRFWKIFQQPEKSSFNQQSSLLVGNMRSLR